MDTIDLFLRIVRVSVRGFLATRYIISVVVGVVVLSYAGLWLAGYVPDYVTLARRISLTSRALFYLLYLAVAVPTVLIWVLASRKLGDAAKKRIDVRWLFRHTDRTGVTVYSVALLVITMVIYFMLGSVNTIARDVVAFLALLAILPLLLDFVPTGSRRVVAGDRVQSMSDIREELTGQATWEEVREYNLRDRSKTAALPDNVKTLPDGFVLEVPPPDLLAIVTETVIV